jgi:hypothetical protein
MNRTGQSQRSWEINGIYSYCNPQYCPTSDRSSTALATSDRPREGSIHTEAEYRRQRNLGSAVVIRGWLSTVGHRPSQTKHDVLAVEDFRGTEERAPMDLSVQRRREKWPAGKSPGPDGLP